MIRKIYAIGRNFAIQMRKENMSAFAASTAFFIFLSLFPILIVICAMIPYTPLTQDFLVQTVTAITPQAVDAFAEGLIAEMYEKSAGILSIALITSVWSASKGILALMRGLNAVNDVEEERNYFVVRFVAFMYTLVMLIGILLSLVIMVFGNKIIETLLFYVPQLQVVATWVNNLRFLFVWVVLTILFALVYAYVPNKKLHFREQIPGATFTAVSWSVFSWFFSMYITYSDIARVYGSLSIIIIILLWMYFCMYMVLVGAYINRYFSRRCMDGEKKV